MLTGFFYLTGWAISLNYLVGLQKSLAWRGLPYKSLIGKTAHSSKAAGGSIDQG